MFLTRNLHTYYDTLDDHLSLESAYRALIENGVPILPLEFASEKYAETKKVVATLGSVQKTVDDITYRLQSDGKNYYKLSSRIVYPRWADPK